MVGIQIPTVCVYFTSKFIFAFIPESKPVEVVESAMMETDATAANDASTSIVKLETTVDQLSPDKQAQQSTIEKLTQILSGTKSIYFHLQVSNQLPGLSFFFQQSFYLGNFLSMTYTVEI